MRFTTYGVVAGLAVLAACGPAEGYGRGGVVRAGAVAGPGGVAVGGSRAAVATGPFGGVQAAGAQRGTYVGPGGTTVQAGRVGGASVGPLGGVRAGGAEAVRVTTPGGRTYTDVDRGRVAVGPGGGVRVAGASTTAVGGAYGGTAVTRRSGVAVGPYGGAVGGYRAGTVVEQTTTYMSPNSVRAAAAVARSGSTYSEFTPNWYQTHTAAWAGTRWAGPVRGVPAWSSVAGYCRVTGPAVSYDYGGTVVVQDGTVYVNGDPVGTAASYAAGAAAIAETGRAARPPDTDEWMPLGVFGLIQENEPSAQRIFQLGVNRAGVIRGNYHDVVADTTLPVYGSVDPRTQRAAWSIGERKDVVIEAGLTNLTQNETTVLVHLGKDRTRQMVLVRLEEPADGR
jgi:hypothetical protein